MIGAIAGDMIGSVYEARPIKKKDFPLFHPACRFTDDSVLTIAVARAILEDRDYRRWVLAFGRRYPHAGYGRSFERWLRAESPEPYGSWGNGSAMRASPVGFAFDDMGTVAAEAAKSAGISHDHPEGIKGAQAAAVAVFAARTFRDKTIVKDEIQRRFGYDLNRSIDRIRPGYRFEVSCRKSVPEAIIAFLESESYEDAVRNAVSLGGDADTQACIAGGIAEAYYGGIPKGMVQEVKNRLTPELWEIVEHFYARFCMTMETD